MPTTHTLRNRHCYRVHDGKSRRYPFDVAARLLVTAALVQESHDPASVFMVPISGANMYYLWSQNKQKAVFAPPQQEALKGPDWVTTLPGLFTVN